MLDRCPLELAGCQYEDMHRLATVNDFVTIQKIERAAGQAFRTIGMDSVADDDPVSASAFEGFLTRDGAWVTVADDDSVVAYLLIELLDAAMYVEQVTVHPRSARQGLGAGLLDVASERAADNNLAAVTLTTFRDVPWNAPYYVRLGFAVTTEGQWGSALQHKVATEATKGLDKWPRVVMQRLVS